MSTSSDNNSLTSQHEDWRVRLFGSYIQTNPKVDAEVDQDVEAQFASLVPTEQAFDDEKYDYIAVFLGADYCPHCKEFAPTVNQSAATLEAKRTKIIFVSNDRTKEAFQASCNKNAGLNVMPYDLGRTVVMRDLFELETIPALVILDNKNFTTAEYPTTVVSNGRAALVDDPRAQHFPWAATLANQQGNTIGTKEHMTFRDRLIISGKYGKWYELGHHANPSKPGEVYMDENAVRIRAGLINIITWIALINIFFWQETVFVKVLFPLVAFEFLVSANIGLGPVAPIGSLATLIACVLQLEPHWKPAKPKRFAWYIGLTLSTLCLIVFTQRKGLGDTWYRPLIGAVVSTCNLATWLESSAGFCIGCFIYNTVLTPLLNLEECSECKL